MKRLVASLLLALTLAVPASAQQRGDNRRGPLHGPGWADPSDVIAAEIAFARLAQDKGQWTAFRQTAARDAQMFAGSPVLGAVRVAAYLQGRKDPAESIKWQPHAVWMACDGSYAVTRGAWQVAKANGWFITVWQRQDKGGYKWVLDQGGDAKEPLPAPEFLTAKLAECPPRAHREDRGEDGDHGRNRPPAKPKRPAGAPPPDYLVGQSDDGSLAWSTTLDPDGARHFTLRLRQDGTLREVVRADAAPAG